MKKVILYLLIFSFFNYIGCYSPKVVSKNIFYSEKSTKASDEIIIVTNKDHIIGIEKAALQVNNDTLYAKGINKTKTTVYGQPLDVEIALEDIQYVEIEEPGALKTVGCIIGSAGLALLLAGIIASAFIEQPSCTEPSNDLFDWG